VAGDHPRTTYRQFAFNNVQIGATDPAGPHPQQNLTLFWCRLSHLANPKRPL